MSAVEERWLPQDIFMQNLRDAAGRRLPQDISMADVSPYGDDRQLLSEVLDWLSSSSSTSSSSSSESDSNENESS